VIGAQLLRAPGMKTCDTVGSMNTSRSIRERKGEEGKFFTGGERYQ
jgi:hypothetical protein